MEEWTREEAVRVDCDRWPRGFVELVLDDRHGQAVKRAKSEAPTVMTGTPLDLN